jgi:hypothetical protein
MQAHARRFDVSVFRREFGEFVAQAWNSHRDGAYNE